MDQINYIKHLLKELDKTKLNIRDAGVFIFVKEKVKVIFWTLDMDHSRTEHDFDSCEGAIFYLETLL